MVKKYTATSGKEVTHAYVGVCQCGGWRSMAVDEGRKQDLAYCHGADRIERVPLEQARAWPACKCPNIVAQRVIAHLKAPGDGKP